MYLSEGKIGDDHKICDIRLPINMDKRLEALGMLADVANGADDAAGLLEGDGENLGKIGRAHV